MEFWGVEVKAGEPLVVEPEDNIVLHLSQACLAESKKDKGTEPVHLYAKTSGQKLVIGILSYDKFPQISFDLVFDDKFELSHNWKNGSVHFTGYRALVPLESDDSDSEDDEPLIPAPAKEEIKTVETNKDVKSDQKVDSSDSDEENSSDDEESDDEPLAKVKNDEESSENDEESEDDDGSEDEDESESEEEDEETPEKAKNGKKRSAESSKKTPVAEKKARLVTPEKSDIKTDGKKGGGSHTATPYPSKQVGKKAANSDQGKQQTPKSGGAFHCKPCNRSFNSEVALQSHTKAKHQ